MCTAITLFRSHNVHLLTLGAHAQQGYCTGPVCLCVCVCVYSGTTDYEAAKERYQRPERYVGMVLKRRFS